MKVPNPRSKMQTLKISTLLYTHKTDEYLSVVWTRITPKKTQSLSSCFFCHKKRERHRMILLFVIVMADLRPRVAVCVCGLASRFQPEHVAKHVIAANLDEFAFDVFLSLQTHEQHFSNNKGRHTKATAYANLDDDEIREHAVRIYLETATQFDGSIALSTRERKHVTEYASELGVAELDRFTQPNYWPLRGNIVAMLVNQEECARAIVASEVATSRRYAFIVMAREDTFLHKKLDLTQVIGLLERNCSLIARDCLSWGGISTRLQVTTRNFGLRLYQTRLDFYRYLCNAGLTVRNTEEFEKRQVAWLHGTPCNVSVELLPVAVSRYINQSAVCFIHIEVDNCIPAGYEDFVADNICELGVF
jgi:hypothetical protein